MDPQPFNHQDKPSQDSEPSIMEEQPTQSANSVVGTEKKSHKRAIIMAAIGFLLIVGALLGYLLYSREPTDTTTQDEAAPTAATTPLDETANIYTDGAVNETNITDLEESTDDVSDASNAASNVGDGVNENNF